MPESAVHVRGLKELERAFRLADKSEQKLLRQELKAAAVPVQRAAEGMALGRIRKMDPTWAQMRIGQKRSVVYIVPKQKGRRSKANPRLRRPNLKTLLLDRAMIPALNSRKDDVIRSLEHMLAVVGNQWERV